MISPMRPPRTPLGLMMTKVVCMWISGSKVQKRVTNLTLPAFFVLNPFNESRRLRYIFPPRGHSSVGRASASHADGRRFESDCPLHFSPDLQGKLMGDNRKSVDTIGMKWSVVSKTKGHAQIRFRVNGRQ